MMRADRHAPRDNDPLIRALANLVVSAHQNQWGLLTWWLESGEPLLQRCSCRRIGGNQQCVCQMEFAVDPRWTCIARMRVLAKRHPGHAPKQRCALCRASDHLLAPRYEVKMSIAGGGPNWIELAPNYGTHTRRDHKKRAARAGGFPPGSADGQLRRALDPDAGRVGS